MEASYPARRVTRQRRDPGYYSVWLCLHDAAEKLALASSRQKEAGYCLGGMNILPCKHFARVTRPPEIECMCFAFEI
jgi:hypothetical protein